jgi:PAS domain-containing protein
LKAKIEPLPKLDPIEEVKVASLEELVESNLEDDVHFFTDEIDKDEGPTNPEPLDELLEPPKPPIELKHLPSGLKYAFLNDDLDSPVIISDKLSQEESLRLITVLEKHRAIFGYSLQDLKGISLVLCTHRIPTDLDITPSREPQRRLNNTIREVVKTEVLKLLHAEIIYPVLHSEWVSPVQVVPKKGGMTVVKNDKNELIP